MDVGCTQTPYGRARPNDPEVDIVFSLSLRIQYSFDQKICMFYGIKLSSCFSLFTRYKRSDKSNVFAVFALMCTFFHIYI